ncbi:hypothetical protein BB558_001998 [Smittium angustum]|uniref:G-patch domain-containing protein n=1 Tax=Smittium angustum TaxID=133377 RepID=A0A2U1J9U2_SMIAN|nr:hypothetical protein BB558_001998 [Smittium angustum]
MFGQVQLEKYGWNKGEGLGKNKSGIKRAITVSKKNEMLGIGAERDNWTGSWWDQLYNKTTKNVNPVNETKSKKETCNDDTMENIGKVSFESTEDKNINEEKYKAPLTFNVNNPGSLYHGMFVKSQGESSDVYKNSQVKNLSTKNTFLGEKEVYSGSTDFSLNLTDEQLFEACEGRMARKGARAEQVGKLKRVQKGTGEPNPEIYHVISTSIINI